MSAARIETPTERVSSRYSEPMLKVDSRSCRL